MNGLASEIAKNLVLSGINSLTLLDSTDVNIRETGKKKLYFKARNQ